MNKHYNKEFKENAVNKVIANNRKVAEVAEELNLVPQTLYRWLQNHRKNYNTIDKSHVKDNNKKHIQRLETENTILKKSRFLDNNTNTIFNFIYAHKSEFAISTMCDLLGVSGSGYYKWLKSVPSNEMVRHNSLKHLIQALYLTHGPNIGSPTLTELLLKQNIDASQATVARILRDNKDNWHRMHPKFHRDNQITLDFPTKDDMWCSDTETFYSINQDGDAIKHMLYSRSFTNFKRYDKKGAQHVSGFRSSDNLIIKGDNLVALHHLQAHFKNKIQLIYLDPPYNNDNYTTCYPNNYSQSTYLTFIKNRLKAMKPLLKATGTIFIQCSNHNQAYIRILCDQTFGRKNFINQIIWRRSQSQQNRGKIASVVDYILIYAKDIDRVKLNKFPLSDIDKEIYRFQDAKGFYRVDRIADNKNGYYHYNIVTPSGRIINGKWKYPKTTFLQLLQNDKIYWSDKYPYKKVYLHENEDKIPSDLWIDSERYGSNQQASRELKQLFGKDIFTYPKPELLMYRIIQLATEEGDIVLDPFLGSATTAAVAHKMQRQYIGIEILDYIEDVSIERLKRIISGDKGGISSEVNWADGGSFIYTELKNHRNDE